MVSSRHRNRCDHSEVDMERVSSIFRSVAGLFSGAIVSLAAFGLVLTAAWSVSGESHAIKLIGAIVASAIGMLLGGFVVAWLDKGRGLTLAAAHGLLFGGFSFAYILGIDLAALVLALLSAAVAAAGGLVFQRMVRDRRPEAGLTAG